MSDIELYESTWKLAARVNNTPFVPKAMQGKPEHVLACVLYGREIGLGPMQALNSIHIIEGRAAASPELMRALVAKAGHRIDITENTNEACTMKGNRADTGAEATVRWSLEDAKAAGLTHKDNWKKYPRAMLAARATSELCRLLFPDVIAGLSYTPEEVESINNAGTVTPPRQDAEESPAPIADEEEIIYDAVIVEENDAPSAPSSGPDQTGEIVDPGPDAMQLVMEAFPGSEVLEGELLDEHTMRMRRAKIKTWGNWNRVRAVAVPLARGHKFPVPQGIDDLIANDELFEMVAIQLEPRNG